MSVPPLESDTIYDPDKKPLIEVTITYIEGQIKKLDGNGKPTGEFSKKDRIRMRVRNLSDKEVKINDSKPELARNNRWKYKELRTVSFPRENSRVQCTFFLKIVDQDPSFVKIIYSAKLSPNSSIRFDVGWENQVEGECGMTRTPYMPPGCLQTKIYLWKANNYRCYRGHEQEHDYRSWLCIYCATPKIDGEIPNYCPQHGKATGLEYDFDDIMRSRDPEPVMPSC